LTPEQWAEIERLAGAHRFRDLRVRERTAGLDAIHPIIALETADGATNRVKKIGSDPHPDFDPLYRYLSSLCQSPGELIHEGKYDWDWTPPGFRPDSVFGKE
jgi:hypothetical protein